MVRPGAGQDLDAALTDYLSLLSTVLDPALGCEAGPVLGLGTLVDKSLDEDLEVVRRREGVEVDRDGLVLGDRKVE